VILGFNLRGKLFLGDGGAYALGILMGCGAILTYSANPGTVFADTIVVWLALPVFDCLRVIFRRKLAGESPFLPQRDHLHHHFINAQGPGLALAFTASFSVVFGLLSLRVPEYSYLIVAAQLATIAAVVLVTGKRRLAERAAAE
jgi:UDP-GlcNAc:undecaprenyl-phosphate GlcNAc-1-phosphate transferase